MISSPRQTKTIADVQLQPSNGHYLLVFNFTDGSSIKQLCNTKEEAIAFAELLLYEPIGKAN